MDNRLSLAFGKRVSRLRSQDLPDVAYGLTLTIRNLSPVQITQKSIGGAPTMLFSSPDFKLAILVSDWLLIEPYFKDYTLSPVFYPTPDFYATLKGPPPRNRIQTDTLYKRVLDVLTLLFPESYPKPK